MTLRLTFVPLALLVALSAAHAQATEGEVRKVDKGQARITLKHGELKHLDMPAMTMVYRVSNPRLLDGLAEGDKVVFDAGKIGDQYIVTALKKMR
jgi:Cu(I)/Ag(I) efflux system protein CusF